ncbi:RDD family protein [Mucilaginibacter boryungensis]|uniref:RDD family protein n=1 Tax=Mucilaginibacter boryungensis TaxID=768480 RepID=A0ABR9XHJ0_9SPHI|nr:RDD family protein [Mucilaginibacter boryungensis]MBE9666854.1 RDD family protein [Mucilaginibacter boryungensis]
METIKITTSQNVEIDYAVAGLGDRVVARIIDMSIFGGISYLGTIIFVGVSANSGRADWTKSTGFIVTIVIWLAFFVFYDLIAEIFFNGQSIGKRLMKIKVVSLNGARPSVGQYLLRWLFRAVDFGITLGSLAVVSIALTDDKQRTGDIIAGTTLVKTEPLNKFKDLFFQEPGAEHITTYPQVALLTDKDINLIHEVISYFKATGNSLLIYKLAMRIKAFLGVSYPPEINEYQFLEMIVQDYTTLTAGYEV